MQRTNRNQNKLKTKVKKLKTQKIPQKSHVKMVFVEEQRRPRRRRRHCLLLPVSQMANGSTEKQTPTAARPDTRNQLHSGFLKRTSGDEQRLSQPRSTTRQINSKQFGDLKKREKKIQNS